METPALKQLMGAYLHQDYDLIGDVPDNVDAFMEESPQLAPLLPSEVEWVLNAYETEEQLAEFVYGLGCQLRPGEGGFPAFLSGIAQQISEGEEGLRRRKAARGPFHGTRPPRHASTFPDQATAEAAIDELLTAHEREFEAWVADGPDERLVLRGTASRVIGRSMDGFTYKSAEVRGVHAVLLRGPDYPDGWAVHTAYPIAEPSPPTRHAPALAHLMGGYFHQDWDQDYADQAAAVSDFLLGSPTWAPRLADEIEQLLRDVPGEADVRAHLEAIGCEFSTRPGTESYRGWLTHVAERARSATAPG